MKDSALLPYALGASDLASSLAPKALKDSLKASIGEIKQAWSDEVEKAKRKATGAFTPEPPPAAAPKQAPEPIKIIPPAKNKKVPKGPPPKAVKQ
jgi:hypothetical protein